MGLEDGEVSVDVGCMEEGLGTASVDSEVMEAVVDVEREAGRKMGYKGILSVWFE